MTLYVYTSRKKHFFEMKGDVGMAGVQIMKKEVNKTTTTTNTSYSIPTSFVGTAYPWVHVKDVGMEYDVFVVVVVLFTSFFIICTPAIPTSPFISKKCFFLLVPPIFCAPGCCRCNTVRQAKLALLKGKTQSTRPTVPMPRT